MPATLEPGPRAGVAAAATYVTEFTRRCAGRTGRNAGWQLAGGDRRLRAACRAAHPWALPAAASSPDEATVGAPLQV